MSMTYEILGKAYPVVGYVTTPQIGTVPLVWCRTSSTVR